MLDLLRPEHCWGAGSISRTEVGDRNYPYLAVLTSDSPPRRVTQWRLLRNRIRHSQHIVNLRLSPSSRAVNCRFGVRETLRYRVVGKWSGDRSFGHEPRLFVFRPPRKFPCAPGTARVSGRGFASRPPIHEHAAHSTPRNKFPSQANHIGSCLAQTTRRRAQCGRLPRVRTHGIQ